VYTLADKPRMLPVEKVREESADVKSIFFRDEACSRAEPGQFAMVWLPGIDEVPMSLTSMKPSRKVSAVAVKRVGAATAAMHKLKEGSLVGIRGPYGNSFKTVEGTVVVVGGGVGMAPLLPLTERLKTDKTSITAVIGAETRRQLLFVGKMRTILRERDKVITATEDGTAGITGYVTDVLKPLLSKEAYRQVYACGPELMMSKTLEICVKHGVACQFSLVRYMKCGVGICGSCMLDGYRVCRDGPVFSGDVLAGVEEFGVAERDASGRRVPFPRQQRKRLK